MPRGQATLEACRLRLRPILMTSFAFILGVCAAGDRPGALCQMREGAGIAVFSGMLGVTFFGIFSTPVFYYVIQTFAEILGTVPGDAAVGDLLIPQGFQPLAGGKPPPPPPVPRHTTTDRPRRGPTISPESRSETRGKGVRE